VFLWNIEKFFVMEILLLNINSNKILWNWIVLVLLVLKSLVPMFHSSVKMIKTLVNLSVNLYECGVSVKL
jgi:hypothetical protein